MNDYWNLSDGQKRMVLEHTATKVGLPVESVEKDLWVTAVLECVFSLPYADKFVFKCPIKVLHGDESYYSISNQYPRITSLFRKRRSSRMAKHG